MKFISKGQNTITYESNNTNLKISYIKIKSTETKTLRYKLTNGAVISYGIYVPTTYKVNLIPFDIIDNLSCEMQFSTSSVLNGFLSPVVYDIYKPGLNPLVDAPTFSLSFPKNTNNLLKTMPNFPGQWYLKISTNYKISNQDTTTIAVQKVVANTSSAATGCNVKCEDFITTVYNNILQTCECRDPTALFNSVTQTCYLNCAKYNLLDSSVVANKLFVNET